MHCKNCRGAQLVLVDISLKGESLRMHSCSRCDTRWWECNGERIELDGVLDMATVRR